MTIGRTSGVGASEPPASVTVKLAVSAPDFPRRSGQTGSTAAADRAAEDALRRMEQPAAELALNSRGQRPTGPLLVESYAKLRYDKQTKTIMIQIINATSGEVMREIPPDAWQKTNPGLPLPRGTLVEENR